MCKNDCAICKCQADLEEVKIDTIEVAVGGVSVNVKVTMKGRTITVEFDGNVGVAKCNPKDRFSEPLGILLAFTRLLLKANAGK